MAGLYLAAIVVSWGFVVALDVRFRLALRPAPVRTAIAVLIGTVLLLAADTVAIALGIFVQGDSPAYLGLSLAPHLPIEEPVFLSFLCYLALVSREAAMRVRDRRTRTESR